MIGIKLDTEYLKLDPQTRVGLEYYNPVFSDAVMQGDYALPVNIPYKGNVALLGWVHHMHTVDKVKQYINSKLYFNKTPLSSGVMDVQSVDDNYVSASFRLNMGGLPCMSRKLKDLDLGGIRDLGDDVATIIGNANNIIQLDVNDTDYNFPMIYNPEFYGDKNPDYGGFMNNFESNIGLFDNALSNKNVLVPMPYIIYLLRQGFGSDNYTVSFSLGSIGGSPYSANELILYNNRALDKRSTTSGVKGFQATRTSNQLFPVNEENGLLFDDDSSGTNFNYDSCYDGTLGTFTVTYTGLHHFKMVSKFATVFGVGNSVITVRVYQNADVIKTFTYSIPGGTGIPKTFVSIEFDRYFGGVAVGDQISITVEATGWPVIAYSSDSIFTITNYSTIYGPNVFQGKFMLNDHVPDITFGALVNALRLTFNLELIWDHGARQVIMQPVGNGVASLRDWSDRKTVGHKINFNNDKTIRSFGYTFPGDDALVTDNFKKVDSLFYLDTVDSLNDAEMLYPAGDALENRILLFRNVNQYWRCEQQPDTSWQWVYYTDNYFEKIVNSAGTKDVRPEMAPLFMKDHVRDYLGLDHFVTPHISQLGSSSEFDIGDNPYGLRFFYYLGDWDVKYAGDHIPFSTTTNLDVTGDVWGSIVNLNWLDEGELSLTELWKVLVDAMSFNEWYEMRLRIYLMDIINFSIGGYYYINHQLWLMDTLKVDIGEDIGEATVTMLKMTQPVTERIVS